MGELPNYNCSGDGLGTWRAAKSGILY